MGNDSRANSPFEAVTDIAGDRTTSAFELLSDETRLAILVALWDAIDPEPPFGEADTDAVEFSELRRRVGVADSGQFNYHLDKLVGRFLERTEEGYTLRTPAEQLLRAVFSGTLADPDGFMGEPTDAPCFHCGSPMLIDYEDGVLRYRCEACDGVWHHSEAPEGLVASAYRPPVGLRDRSPQEFHRYGNTWDRHRREAMMEGVCPDCSGRVVSTTYGCPEHDTTAEVCEHCGALYEHQTVFRCTICKFVWETPAFAPVFLDVGVISFFHEHGLDTKRLFDAGESKVLRDAVVDVRITREDPVELTVVLEVAGDGLEVRLDGDARVTSVRPRSETA